MAPMISRRRFRIVSLGLCLPPTIFSFVCPSSFHISSRSSRRTVPPPLFTSLSVPPTGRAHHHIEDNDGDDHKFPLNFNNRFGRLSKNSAKPSFGFQCYLRGLLRSVRKRRTCAAIMDDELQRMELRWYGGEETSPRSKRKLRDYFRGPAVQPDVLCYAMVANAYARAGGQDAELAENVLRRCELHAEQDETAEKPNSILWTAVMSAWAKAGDWDRADYWLKHIEDTYAITKSRLDAPDVITYSSYLETLSTTKEKSGQQIAQKAKDILAHMHELADSGENVYAMPNTFSYAAAIKCQARGRDGMEPVEALLRRLQELYEASGDVSLKPGTLAYLPVLSAWSRCGGGLEAARRADALKDELHDMYEQTGDMDFHPHVGIYTSVFSSYARVEPDATAVASKRVLELLDQLDNDPKVRRSVHCYIAAIKALTRDGVPSGPEEAEKILQRMPKHEDAYSHVLRAYARDGEAEKAEDILMEMEKLANDRKIKHGGGIAAHVACVRAWIRVYKQDKIHVALERADALLSRIVRLYRKGLVLTSERDVDSWLFSTIIQLWATSRHPQAPERVEKMISLMEEMSSFLSGDDGAKHMPSQASYIYGLDAWAASGHRDAGTHAMQLLKKLQDKHAEDENYPGPNSRAISSALTSVTKSGRPEGEIAEDLLRRLLQLYTEGDRLSLPTPRSYTSVLRAIIRSRDVDADKRALALFRDIRDWCDEHDDDIVAVNAITYNCVLNGLAKSGSLDEAEQLFYEMKERYNAGRTEEKPGVVTYSTMIEALARSDRDDAADQVEKLFNEMQVAYRVYGDSSLKPDTQLYNSVLRTLAHAAEKDPSAAEKAHNILRNMESSAANGDHAAPDLLSYSAVCRAYAKSDRPDSADKAAEILNHVEALSETGVVPPPDQFLYSKVILAYSRSNSTGSQYKAEALFNHTESLYEAGRYDLRPNTRIMNPLISGWANCRSGNKVERASAVLERMKRMHAAGNPNVQPNVFSYNLVIRAAALSKSARQEDRILHFQVALDNFKLLHELEDVKPDASTYIQFVRACKALMPKGGSRDKLIDHSFTLARKNGLVSDAIVKQMIVFRPDVLRTALEAEGAELPDTAQITISNVPEKWRCNIRNHVQCGSSTSTR